MENNLPSDRYHVTVDFVKYEFNLYFDGKHIGIHESMQDAINHAIDYDMLRTVSFNHTFKYKESECI